jgi:hypothetical protein
MLKRVKLNSLEIKDYQGAEDQSLRLQLDGNHAVRGFNGSGKTTLQSAPSATPRFRARRLGFEEPQGPIRHCWSGIPVLPVTTAQRRC